MNESDPFAPKPRVEPVEDVLAEQALIEATKDVTTPCHCGAHQLHTEGEHVFPFRDENESHTHVTCTRKDDEGVWHPIEQSQSPVVADAGVTGPTDGDTSSDPNVATTDSATPLADEGEAVTGD